LLANAGDGTATRMALAMVFMGGKKGDVRRRTMPALAHNG
jgi:hypothetical protein